MKSLFIMKSLLVFGFLGQLFASSIEILFAPESLHLQQTTSQLDDLSKFAALCLGLTTEAPINFDGFKGYRNFESIPTTFIAFQTNQSIKKSSNFVFPYDSEYVDKDFDHISNILSARFNNLLTKKFDFSGKKTISQQIQELNKEVDNFDKLKLKGQLGDKSVFLFTFSDAKKDGSAKLKDSIISTIEKLRNTFDDKAVLLNINDADTQPLVRNARAANDKINADSKTKYSLAYEYSADYHTAFATIGATTIVLILTVFGVSVAMWNIDPGRDSIIYRLTAQKMKKDQ